MLVGHSCLLYAFGSWCTGVAYSEVNRLGVLRFRFTATLQPLGLISHWVLCFILKNSAADCAVNSAVDMHISAFHHGLLCCRPRLLAGFCRR